MASLSTHVLDSAGGGPQTGVVVEVHDIGGSVVADGKTDERGRIESLAIGLDPGEYKIIWRLQGQFIGDLEATVHLSEDRHYHVPLVASGYSAAIYLGA